MDKKHSEFKVTLNQKGKITSKVFKRFVMISDKDAQTNNLYTNATLLHYELDTTKADEEKAAKAKAEKAEKAKAAKIAKEKAEAEKKEKENEGKK
jgi:hypothetical protein